MFFSLNRSNLTLLLVCFHVAKLLLALNADSLAVSSHILHPLIVGLALDLEEGRHVPFALPLLGPLTRPPLMLYRGIGHAVMMRYIPSILLYNIILLPPHSCLF